MKIVLILMLTCIGFKGFSQKINKVKPVDSLPKITKEKINKQFVKDSILHAKYKQSLQKRVTDSLSIVVQSKLQIPSKKADAVIAIVNIAVSKMNSIARNRQIKGQDKITKFKAIAKERDYNLGLLLSANQLNDLQKIMLANKQNNINK